ncbi:MAG: hypothetical protein AAF235_01600 [Planctomycetota bacterium]
MQNVRSTENCARWRALHAAVPACIGLVMLAVFSVSPASGSGVSRDADRTQPPKQEAAAAGGGDGHALEPLDLWYVLDINGQRSGSMHRTRSVADGLVTTVSDVDLEIRRGPIAISISTDSVWIETIDGRPVEMRSVQDLGMGQPSTAVFRFGDDGRVAIERETGGVRSTDTADAPGGDWLPPAAAGRAFRRGMDAGAATIELKTLDPSRGLSVVTPPRRGF